MPNDELLSSRIRHTIPPTAFSRDHAGDPLTLRWVQEAMVLAVATGGSTLMQEELAATLVSESLLEHLGIEAPRNPPDWFSLLVETSEGLDMFSPETVPTGALPLDPSLPRKVALLLRAGAPLQECFGAFLASKDSIFDRLFGAAWRVRFGSPRMRLQDAQACAVTVERALRKSLLGQAEAVMALKRLAFELELRRGQKAPPATALFLGPPGVGKSLAARQFAAALSMAAEAGLGDPWRVMEIEMTQYTQWNSGLELIGNGNGNGALSAFVAQHPRSVILCNEFEKGHRKVLESFLPLLDQGFLPRNGDTPVDFREAVFLFSSNLGSEFWDRPSSPEEHTLTVDPLDLLSLASHPDERNEWYKTPVPAELLSRLAKGPVVLFRRHLGHHLVAKVDGTCRAKQEEK